MCLSAFGDTVDTGCTQSVFFPAATGLQFVFVFLTLIFVFVYLYLYKEFFSQMVIQLIRATVRCTQPGFLSGYRTAMNLTAFQPRPIVAKQCGDKADHFHLYFRISFWMFTCTFRIYNCPHILYLYFSAYLYFISSDRSSYSAGGLL